MNTITAHKPTAATPTGIRARAFTLVELLIIVALIIIMLLMVFPAGTEMFRSQELTAAGRILEQSFNNARTLAVTKNRRVEVRIIKSSTENRIRGLQIYEFDETGTRPVPASAFRRFPNSVTANEHGQNSTLWDNLPVKSFNSNDPQLPIRGMGTAYEARWFQFLPNGSIDRDPAQRWFLTVHNNNHNPTQASLPPNFYCVQIEPVLGTVRSYRP